MTQRSPPEARQLLLNMCRLVSFETEWHMFHQREGKRAGDGIIDDINYDEDDYDDDGFDYNTSGFWGNRCEGCIPMRGGARSTFSSSSGTRVL